MPSLRSACAGEIELRCSVILEKAIPPIRPMESHINKLHKYFLWEAEGDFLLTVR